MFGYRSNFKTKRLMKQIVQANQETNLYGVQPLRKKAYQVIKDYNGWWESPRTDMSRTWKRHRKTQYIM